MSTAATTFLSGITERPYQVIKHELNFPDREKFATISQTIVTFPFFFWRKVERFES
jgi:hypothetical protein